MIDRLFDLALWLAVIGHACVLGASFQVPGRLGWGQDLAQLRPFNRKLMWTYGGFTVMTIIAFGSLTAILHDEFLHGDRAAIALAGFIGIYWASRVAVDFLYFDNRDWPRGLGFTIGHLLLTGLFVSLAITYLGLIAWRAMKAG
jgi:alginate O-acetyltransferase complex protein AlgI